MEVEDLAFHDFEVNKDLAVHDFEVVKGLTVHDFEVDEESSCCGEISNADHSSGMVTPGGK